MANTVNSRFLAIGSGEPNINAGWSIRVLDYKDKKSLVAVMNEFREMSFTMELNAVGQGSVTLDEDSPWWTSILNNGSSNRALLNREYIFEAWDNNTPRFAWLAQTVTNTIVGEDETRAITISGPGIAQHLARAKIFRPGWPTKVPVTKTTISPADGHTKIYSYRETSSNDKLPAYKWEFPYNWPTMRMWYTVFRAAQRRGLITWISPMFTYLKDSGKQDFLYVKTLASAQKQGFRPEDPNMNLLDFLNDCTGQDYSKWFGQRLEWIMYPGFKLDVRRNIGADLSKTVRFFQGNIIGDERTRDRENIVTRISVLNNNNNEVIRSDKNMIAAWDIREEWNTATKEVTDVAIQGQIADRLLAQNSNEKDQLVIQIPYDDPGRVPFRNFTVGDKVGFNADYFGSTPTATSAPSPMRVMAITISVTADNVIPDVELALQSVIESKLQQLQRQITELQNKARNIALDDLTNVNTSAATNGSTTGDSTLVYKASSQQWEASPGGGGNSVYFGSADPAASHPVNVGDFWIQDI